MRRTSGIADGKQQLKATLSISKASFPGAELATLSDVTNPTLANHRFVVVRCVSTNELKMARLFAKTVAGWPLLDEVELED